MKIDQATQDRAVSVLLSIAESDEEATEERLQALALLVEPVPESDYDEIARRLFALTESKDPVQP